jgi:eukaryotic-like serine/threonine-protein kinase
LNRNLIGAPSIASMVAQAADEYLAQLHRGETPDISDYRRRYPQVASVLPQVLPVLEMICVLDPGDSLERTSVDELGVLGEFRLVREIGRGGMGVVYEAVQITLDRRVALKVLPVGASVDAKQLARFQIEVQVAAALHHSHIVPIFAVGCDRGVHYYAMQLIEGHSLAEALRDPRQEADCDAENVTAGKTTARVRLSPRKAALLAIQAACALEHAHSVGVLHRDIKPANLMVDGTGHLWVTDFGLARVKGGSDLTTSGDLLGTVRYMSPEQASGSGLLDARTDIYSLGTTLYELLTAQPAFDGKDSQELIRQITSVEPLAPRKLNPDLPRDLETIVGKAMAKEPERRYATAQELADDLERFCEDRPILARRIGLAGRLARWSQRHKKATAFGLVGLFIVTLASVAGMARLWNQQRQTLAALEEAQRAKGRERQALRFTFTASDQITTRALAMIAAPLPASAQTRDDREFCRKALEYYEVIAARYCDDRSMHDIAAAAFHRIGFIRTILKEPLAHQAFERSIALYEMLAQSKAASRELRGELALTYGDLVLLHRNRGEASKVIENLEKLVAIRQALADDPPVDRANRLSLIYHQIDLCELLEAAGQTSSAQAIREKLRASTMLVLPPEGADPRLCNNLAWLFASRAQDGANDSVRAVELARAAVALMPANGLFWNTLGVAQYRAGDWGAAIVALENSMRLQAGGGAHDWLFLAMARWQLGDAKGAKTWYDRSLTAMKDRASENIELSRFKAEAASLLGEK